MVGMDRKNAQARLIGITLKVSLYCAGSSCANYTINPEKKQELSVKSLDTNRHLPTHGNRLDILQKVLEIGGEMCYHNNHV